MGDFRDEQARLIVTELREVADQVCACDRRFRTRRGVYATSSGVSADLSR